MHRIGTIDCFHFTLIKRFQSFIRRSTALLQPIHLSAFNKCRYLGQLCRTQFTYRLLDLYDTHNPLIFAQHPNLSTYPYPKPLLSQLDSECRVGLCLLGQLLPSRNKTFKTKNPRESASLPRPACGACPALPPRLLSGLNPLTPESLQPISFVEPTPRSPTT